MNCPHERFRRVSLAIALFLPTIAGALACLSL